MKNTNMGTWQAASIIITVTIAHIILNMPNHLISFTGSSTILNLIYVFIIALILFYFAFKILKHFPHMDIIDISEYASGKFFKNTISIAICFYFLTIAGFVIRTFADSLVLIYFQNISSQIIIIIFIAICVIMNLLGFKAISRVTLVTLPIILVSMVAIFISLSGDFMPERVFPILGYGASKTFLSGLR